MVDILQSDVDVDVIWLMFCNWYGWL